MKTIQKFALPVLAAALLSSCSLLLLPLLFIFWSSNGNGGVTRTQINFNTDTRILRGGWTGNFISNVNQATSVGAFDLQAEYVDSYHYNLAGSLVFQTKTYTFAAPVYAAYNEEFIKPQTSPVPTGFSSDLKDSAGTVVGHINLDGYYDQTAQQYGGNIYLVEGEAQKPYSFTLKRTP